MKTLNLKTCPCCGFITAPKKAKGLTMCPACFYVDNAGLDVTAHREAWIRDGEMSWMSARTPQPRSWNPLNTLGRLALSITQAKTRGRPPRMN